jgi:hypothetical protein
VGQRGGPEAACRGENDFGQRQFCRDLDRGRRLTTGGPGARGHEILEGWDPKEFTRVR